MALEVQRLGLIDYEEAWARQREIHAQVVEGSAPDTLLLLEHPPVYTKGRRTEAAELPMGEEWYLTQGIEVAGCDRGGRVTYHGPGQLVGYPIMRVHDVLDYVRTTERAVIAALSDEGVTAEVREGLTGIWVEERKIGSIGVHVSRGVTTHGFAVNVENDLQPFEWIVPCGIEGVRMTSLYKETGRPGGLGCFRRRAAWRFAEAFGRRQRIVSLERVLREAGEREAVPA